MVGERVHEDDDGDAVVRSDAGQRLTQTRRPLAGVPGKARQHEEREGDALRYGHGGASPKIAASL